MNFSNINLLSDAYIALRSMGLVESKADFSQRVLGKGSSYLTSMAAKGREPDDAVLVKLRDQLCVWDLYQPAQDGAGLSHSAAMRHNRLAALCMLVVAQLSVNEVFASNTNIVPFSGSSSRN